MLNHPLYAQILSVAKAVQTSEADTDTAILSTARLIETTIIAHRHPDVHAQTVQPALAKLREAMCLAIDARSAIIDFHREVGKTAAKMGADPSTWGDWWPCPKNELTTPAEASPGVVRIRRAAS